MARGAIQAECGGNGVAGVAIGKLEGWKAATDIGKQTEPTDKIKDPLSLTIAQSTNLRWTDGSGARSECMDGAGGGQGERWNQVSGTLSPSAR